MNKTLLLTATAVAVLGFAGTSAAQVRTTAASVSNIALNTTATVPTVYTRATESITTTLANRQTTTTATHNTVATQLPATGSTKFEPNANGTNYTATLTLTGATFQQPITTATLTGQQAGCTPSTPTVVSGGGAGQNTVTVLFNVPNTCTTTTAPSGVTFDIPFTVDASATAVSSSVGYAVASTGAAYGGVNSVASLVQSSAGYRTSASSFPQTVAQKPTSLSLTSTPAFSQLATGAGNDIIIGSALATTATPPANAVNNTVYADMKAATLPALTYTLAVAGDFAVLKPGFAIDDATANAISANGPSTGFTTTNTATGASQTGVSGGSTIYVTIPSGNTTQVTSPKSYNVTVTPGNGSSTLVTAPSAITTAPLETVGLQGTSFIAPWVQSTNASYNTVIRVSNSGAATGPVTLSITSPIAAATRLTCSSAELAKLGSVPANGELAINSADLTTCFGAFTRGDVRVTVQAQTTLLTAKMRIVNPSNVVTEQSLGAISDGVATVN